MIFASQKLAKMLQNEGLPAYRFLGVKNTPLFGGQKGKKEGCRDPSSQKYYASAANRSTACDGHRH